MKQFAALCKQRQRGRLWADKGGWTMLFGDELPRLLVGAGAVSYKNPPVAFRSGLLSPIYIDNRKLWGRPSAYSELVLALEIASDEFLFNMVAGIESGAVPPAAMLAHSVNLPYASIRKEAKGHGLAKRIDGADVTGAKVLIIEDHLTTGGSVLSGVEAIRKEGGTVAGVLATTSYELPEVRENFNTAGVQYMVLVSFGELFRAMMSEGAFPEGAYTDIYQWHKDPWAWTEKEKGK